MTTETIETAKTRSMTLADRPPEVGDMVAFCGVNGAHPPARVTALYPAGEVGLGMNWHGLVPDGFRANYRYVSRADGGPVTVPL